MTERLVCPNCGKVVSFGEFHKMGTGKFIRQTISCNKCDYSGFPLSVDDKSKIKFKPKKR